MEQTRSGGETTGYIESLKNKITRLENTLENNSIHFEKKLAELEAKNRSLGLYPVG
jgi:hypothetical protein